MKIARMEFRSIGLFRSLEIHGLSPGLNIVFGPTGSGKTTLRRAIGGMFYGFEKSGADSLLPNQGVDSSTEAEIEIQGAEYRLRRNENLWDRVVDLVRKSQSGAPRLPVSSGLGGLSSSDYFTFFNVSLIDSPEIHRRMVHALSHSPALTDGSSYWNSEADYLSWRKLAEQRRHDLATLQRELSDSIADRDRLSAQLLSNKDSFGLRLKDLEELIVSLSGQIADLKHRRILIHDELNQKEIQIDHLRQKIQNAPGEQVIRKPVIISDRLVELYKMLDEVQARIGRVRSVQKDLTNRRMEIREARTEASDEPSRVVELEMKTVRKTIVQLEDKIDDLNHALKEAAILDHNDRSVQERYEGDRHLEIKTKDTLAQAKDDLYNLCQDLSQHQRHLARGRMNAESRDLRRCWSELKRQLAWLKIRRKAILDEIRISDISGYELIVRGRRPFCNCARHHGHLEARKKFLEEKSEEVIVQPGVDTSAWESELRGLLSDVSEIKVRLLDFDRQIAEVDARLQEAISQKNHLLAGQDQLIEKQIADLNHRILALEAQIGELRILVEKDDPLWNLKYDNLFDNASEFLNEISCSNLRTVWLDSGLEKLAVKDNLGRVSRFEELGRSDQDQVCLAICLAVSDRIARNGHYIPMVFDDLFVNLDDNRSKATRKVLRNFVDRGHQIIMFAAHRQLHDRYVSYSPERLAGDSIAVYELPNLSIDLENIRWPIILHPGAGLKPAVAVKPVPQPVFGGVIDEKTLLSVIDLVEPEHLPVLTDHRILTVGDLLDLDHDHLDTRFENRGIDRDLLRRWQNQAWLLCSIPGLRVYDSRLLVGSGITEPEILESLSSQEVLQRLESFLNTTLGRRVMQSGSEYELTRVNRWMSSLRNNDSSWKRRRSRSRGSRNSRSDSKRNSREYSDRSSVRIHRETGTSEKSTESVGSLLRKTFFLSLNDDVEKAPSIGNRMAEKLAAVEVLIVSELLDSDPAILAGRLDDRRIDAETILAWQNQAKLVCQIPNLRGHDAQLLVACEFLTPEQVASADPAKIFAAVVPFAESKQGQKILRSSKKPDMDEINDWILWAQNSRPLSMAVA